MITGDPDVERARGDVGRDMNGEEVKEGKLKSNSGVEAL
jgi:hypothetical protein